MPSFTDRLQHAWNAFTHPEDLRPNYNQVSSFIRPDRPKFTRGNERSIITSVYNRIAVDAASISIKHVKLDENNRYLKTINSSLNNCLTVEANKDQTSRSFIQNVVISMMDEGCVAVVPIDTDIDPNTGSFSIETMRVGQILEWFPDNIKVRLYNDKTGKKEDIIVSKKSTAIIENPFYTVMNEPNSTMQRLIRKLNLLDDIDEQSGAGKLDMIIQLPYALKTEARKEQAEQRRKDIEMQLAGSKYGIAYTDATEKITQLGHSLDNNLMKQVEYLTTQLYSQLGITEAILNGTADEKTMMSYNSRTVEPIVSAITDEFKRKFLTKTARSQKQSIEFFNNPFRLVPITNLADIADRFTRNEIMSSNEMRQIVGMLPVQNEKADELRNKNINPGEGQEFATTDGNDVVTEMPETEVGEGVEEPMVEETPISGDTPISELNNI